MFETIIHDPTAFVLLCMACVPISAGATIFLLALLRAAKYSDEQAERLHDDWAKSEAAAQANLEWLLKLEDRK